MTVARNNIPTENTKLLEELDRLAGLCLEEKNLRENTKRTCWQSDEMVENAYKANSGGLAAKVTALTSIAELAGISTHEGMMMEVLKQHLKQMEEKLQAMSKDQQREATLAMEKQQAQMDLQMQQQKEMYEQKLAEMLNKTVDETEKRNASLALEIEELKASQATLMEEYNKVTCACRCHIISG